MQDISFDTIAVLGMIGLLLLAVLVFRVLFSPDSRQDEAAAARIKRLKDQSGHKLAQAMVVKQRRTRIGRDLPLVGNPALLIRRAEMEGKEPLLVIGTVLSGIVLGTLISFKAGGVIGYPAGFLLAAGAVLQFLKARHRKRVDALTRQLPDALDLMMRGLRIGHPVSATIANVGRTMADPIGSEFRILAEQVSHGDFLTDAFADMAERVGQEDIDYLAVSISIQHGTGGNLAEMLGTLAKVVRDRIMVRRRVRAISSEGRISAYLLSGLPVVIYVTTTFTAPGYYSAVSDDPLFRPLMTAIVLLVVANFLALRKLVNFQF